MYILIKKALSSFSGTANLVEKSDSSYLTSSKSSDKYKKVDVLSFSDFLFNYKIKKIDLISINIEGESINFYNT